jgi:broad specificity phosphatase PhoE
VTEIVLVRHASTSWTGHRYCGRSDPPLDPAGRAAAASLAAAVVPTLVRNVLIITSPARRARETAAALAAPLGIEVEIDERWGEADFGIAEGRTFDELAEDHPDLAAALALGHTDIDWPGGETAAELRSRIAAAWAALVARRRPAVVVSHAGAIRHAVLLAGNLRSDAAEVLEPASLVRLEVRSGEAEPAPVLPSRP